MSNVKKKKLKIYKAWAVLGHIRYNPIIETLLKLCIGVCWDWQQLGIKCVTRSNNIFN